MPSSLRDVTRDFADGDATLEAWRESARAESRDRKLADEILLLIAEWDNAAWTDSARARARTNLRIRAEELVPPAPPVPDKPKWTTRQAPEKSSLYAAGLRGQRRRG